MSDAAVVIMLLIIILTQSYKIRGLSYKVKILEGCESRLNERIRRLEK